QRLIARLIVRLTAMIECFTEAGEKIEDLTQGLRRTFKLAETAPICSEETIDKLSTRYYDINDWITNAFEILLTTLISIPNASEGKRLLGRIHRLEDSLRKKLELKKQNDRVPLKPIELGRLTDLPTGDRGKALFLETLGFDQPEIMAGQFDGTSFEQVMGDF